MTKLSVPRFAYDQVVTLARGTTTRLNIKVNAQQRSLKAILLFMELFAAGTTDLEKYIL